MKGLTIIFVIDITDRCDMCIYSFDYAKKDATLIASLMKKTAVKVESSEFNLSPRTTFSDLLDITPLAYGLRYRFLPKDLTLKSFTDSEKVVQIMICDFTAYGSASSAKSCPVLYYVTDDHGVDVDKSVSCVINDVISSGLRIKVEPVLYEDASV